MVLRIGNDQHETSSGRSEPNTANTADIEVHKERGVPLVYSSDTYAADIPYWIPDPDAMIHGDEDKGMLMIPYSLCTNDHRCTLHSPLLQRILTFSLRCPGSRGVKAG
jgi:hypothetical protein